MRSLHIATQQIHHKATWLGTLAAWVMCGAAWAGDPPNLVTNPGFEDVSPQHFAKSWGVLGEFGKPDARVTLDDKTAHTGARSVRLGENPFTFVICDGADIAVKPDTKYMVTWWCKTEGFTRTAAWLGLCTNQGQRGVGTTFKVHGSSDWNRYFGEYTTKADETRLHPILITHNMGGTPTNSPAAFCWFDDVCVYEGAFPRELEAEYPAWQRNNLAGVSETAVILRNSGDLALWSDNLSARVYADDPVPGYAQPVKAVEMSAARGEEEFFQIALRPAADLEGVSVVTADLEGPGRISATNVHWWPVGFVNVTKASNPDMRLGMTPDPLLNSAPVAAPKAKNTPFCIGVRVPRDAKPGVYKGEVTVVASNNVVARVPIALRVYDFELPTDPTFCARIYFHVETMQRWDNRPPVEIERDICRLLYQHGIRGYGTLGTGVSANGVDAKLVDDQVVCDFTQLDSSIGWALDELGFNTFFLGPCFGGGTGEAVWTPGKWLGMELLSDDFNRLFPEYLRQVAAHLKAKGWFDKTYLYLWDEPHPVYFDKVVALQKLALQADPGFKTWETTSPFNQEFWGVVNAWCVLFARPYFEETDVEARRAAGDEIWVYNMPASLEGPPQVHRLWFWQAARYAARGALLWSVNFYNGTDPWQEITSKPGYEAGEAIMIYPNPQGGLPLSSLRFRLLQKGLDDFEYLTILQQRLEARARAAGSADPAAEAQAGMRKLAVELVKDVGAYDLNSASLTKVRDRVAQQIEELGGGK